MFPTPAPIEDEMDCREFLQIANDLLEQHQDSWSPAVLEHLSSCPPCLIYLGQVQDLHYLLGTLPREGLVPSHAQVLSIIAAAARP